MSERCPDCGGALVPPAGPPLAKILLIGDAPGTTEVRDGRPFSEDNLKILRGEFGRVGLNLATMRITNLWMHRPSKECNMDWHVGEMLKELRGKTAVMIFGASAGEFFLGGSISDFTGLKIKSKYLPKTVRVAVACYNPSIALRGGVGEVRLAIERFAHWSEGVR